MSSFHVHSHAHERPAVPALRPSLLGVSAGLRIGGALVVVAALWLALYAVIG
jgi:hypothetical protein